MKRHKYEKEARGGAVGPRFWCPGPAYKSVDGFDPDSHNIYVKCRSTTKEKKHSLYANMPADVRNLLASAHKHQREQARREFKRVLNPAQPNA